jgi:uncharacterized repeat protein (TIGR01451 family)
MMRGTTSRGDHAAKGPSLRFWVAAATLAAAVAGAVLVAATSGVDDAGAQAADPADLSLEKSDSPDPVNEDAVLTYTLEVKNAGPDPATNVVVSDDLPSQVDPQSPDASQGSCDIQGKKVTCGLGTINSGGEATVTIQVRPRNPGQIANTASVQSDVTDQQPDNNEDTENTTVNEAPQAATCRKKPATISGTGAGEIIPGTNGNDVILAGGGDDQINAGDGKDLICAGGGNDLVLAGAGNDFTKGQAGGDRLKGQGGGDTLKGNRGRDNMRGGSGNDLLGGGKGRDRCKGGGGSDTLRTCNP